MLTRLFTLTIGEFSVLLKWKSWNSDYGKSSSEEVMSETIKKDAIYLYLVFMDMLSVDTKKIVNKRSIYLVTNLFCYWVFRNSYSHISYS